MNDTCVRTHLDVADFDCCDVHESAYRKGGFCLHCRIAELENIVGLDAVRIKAFERREAKLQAQLDNEHEAATFWQSKATELQEQVESDQMMLDIRDTQLRIAKEKLEEQYAFATKCVNKISFYRAALDKLARLGNEPHYGNSDGNCIARKALEQSDGKDTQTHTENTQ